MDCDPKNFNISVDEVEKAITKKTKAIVPVHLFGQSSDMKSIMSLAKKYNLFVIEDNAQAIGSDYLGFNQPQKTGTIGNIGCTSFFPSKNLGCFGDGGAMVTNDDELAKKLRMIANHGQSKRYYHDIVGCNSRLDNIQAAVLRIKLKELDQYILNRQKAANYYDENLKELDQLTLPYRSLDSNHVFHQYTLKLDDFIVRDELIKYLADKKIPAMVYYPVPAHKQKMFSKIPNSYGNMKVTNWLSSRVISLPMHTELSTLQQDYIIENISNFLNK